ncbi:MAG TPA: hypothetical protein VMB74_05185 [Streptosporangiaceae bacterium]|nr:hypothetical protein [Streptosporangiaceae bacterium]
MSIDPHLVTGDLARTGGRPGAWLRAVSAADEAPPADLSAAVAEELVALWSDLASAVRRAPCGRWSAECDALVVRIVILSRLTGPTSWHWIPGELLSNGVYQGVLDAAGLSTSYRPAGPGNAHPRAAVTPQ